MKINVIRVELRDLSNHLELEAHIHRLAEEMQSNSPQHGRFLNYALRFPQFDFAHRKGRSKPYREPIKVKLLENKDEIKKSPVLGGIGLRLRTPIRDGFA